MKIIIETIPHNQQRYNTIGDWFPDSEPSPLPGGTPIAVIRIRVSAMANWRHEALVALHELAEVILCMNDNITPKLVDDFDMSFNGPEPGDDPQSPYKRQHCFATAVERLACAAMGVDWFEYERVSERVSTPVSAPRER